MRRYNLWSSYEHFFHSEGVSSRVKLHSGNFQTILLRLQYSSPCPVLSCPMRRGFWLAARPVGSPLGAPRFAVRYTNASFSSHTQVHSIRPTGLPHMRGQCLLLKPCQSVDHPTPPGLHIVPLRWVEGGVCGGGVGMGEGGRRMEGRGALGN